VKASMQSKSCALIIGIIGQTARTSQLLLEKG
jgi:hypothetical protein